MEQTKFSSSNALFESAKARRPWVPPTLTVEDPAIVTNMMKNGHNEVGVGNTNGPAS